MARTAAAVPVKPLRSRGYGKIVGLTFLAILIGCALMGYEVFVEYNGKISADKIQPKKFSSSLPAPDRTAPPPAPGPMPPGPMPPAPPPGGME